MKGKKTLDGENIEKLIALADALENNTLKYDIKSIYSEAEQTEVDIISQQLDKFAEQRAIQRDGGVRQQKQLTILEELDNQPDKVKVTILLNHMKKLQDQNEKQVDRIQYYEDQVKIYQTNVKNLQIDLEKKTNALYAPIPDDLNSVQRLQYRQIVSTYHRQNDKQEELIQSLIQQIQKHNQNNKSQLVNEETLQKIMDNYNDLLNENDVCKNQIFQMRIDQSQLILKQKTQQQEQQMLTNEVMVLRKRVRDVETRARLRNAVAPQQLVFNTFGNEKQDQQIEIQQLKQSLARTQEQLIKFQHLYSNQKTKPLVMQKCAEELRDIAGFLIEHCLGNEQILKMVLRIRDRADAMVQEICLDAGQRNSKAAAQWRKSRI